MNLTKESILNLISKNAVGDIILKNLPEHLTNDSDFMLKIIEQKRSAIYNIGKDLKKDNDFIKKVGSLNIHILEVAHEYLKDNPETVLCIVENSQESEYIFNIINNNFLLKDEYLVRLLDIHISKGFLNNKNIVRDLEIIEAMSMNRNAFQLIQNELPDIDLDDIGIIKYDDNKIKNGNFLVNGKECELNLAIMSVWSQMKANLIKEYIKENNNKTIVKTIIKKF
jgi:hypothetical protein